MPCAREINAAGFATVSCPNPFLLNDPVVFFSSRRRHTRLQGDWSSDVCSSDLSHTDVPCKAHIFQAKTAGFRTEVLVHPGTSDRLPDFVCRRCRMTKPIARDPMYRKRVFDADIIEPCVRWYITYRLSYRDLVEMMAERGVKVAHSTILRWVTRYVPEFEKRWNRFSRAVGTSWRVDETYIPIKGKWHYLYRAVDKHGKTIDFLLRPDRGIAAAQAFFRKALATQAPRVPRKVTLDGHVPSHRALWLLRREHRCWTNVKVRNCKYLNNIIEQDHRVIKRRCASMTGFKSFVNDAITISGIELAHRIHKLQFSSGRGRQRRGWSRKDEWAMALA